MRTTVILNLKGGVGKTVTADNMAAILARAYRKRVLLVDADSQCNATEFFGGDPARGNLAEVLRHEADEGLFATASIQASNFLGVDLLCGSDELMDLDLTKVELQGVRALVLREIQQLRSDEISEALELDVGTVKSRISRGRKKLRNFLLERGNFSPPPPSKQTGKEGRS